MNNISIWERTGESSMSAEHYAVLVTFWTALGIASSAVTAYIALTSKFPLTLLLLGVIASVLGVLISQNTYDPVISMGGYFLITLSFGLITGPLVAEYTQASVVRILFLTTTMVIGLGIVGALIPKSLENWWTWLFGGLLFLLAGYLLLSLASYLGLPIGNATNAFDWAGVALFSGYVIFDLNRAMRIPYTKKNSIDSALQIYLDVINLLIRLLIQLGQSYLENNADNN